MNCILCNKPHRYDICPNCQANGQVHPLPKEAMIELDRRQAEAQIEDAQEFS